MPADDRQSSPTGPDGTSVSGPAAFATTRWSVVLAAQDESPAAAAALETLCRTYWKPLYAFVRREGANRDDARDLTQGFFALLLERRDLEAVRKEKGRFRSYLLTAFKHFQTDEWRRAVAIKRGKAQKPIPLHEMGAEDRIGQAADWMTPELIYERQWASTVLERVLSRLKEEYHATGKARVFDALKQLLPDEPGAPSQTEIGEQLGLNPNAVRQAFFRFRQRYQALLREEIAQTVASPSEVEDELRYLISVIRR
ncbi:MAG TPA: sigma-70 family RNA polymerase sigma factor [Chthoniobacterales bacterium]